MTFKLGDKVKYGQALIGTIGCIEGDIAYMSECVSGDFKYQYPRGNICEIHKNFMGYCLKDLESTSQTPITFKPSILASKWCVKCYPKKAYAEFTFQCSSLCEECFKRCALL